MREARPSTVKEVKKAQVHLRSSCSHSKRLLGPEVTGKCGVSAVTCGNPTTQHLWQMHVAVKTFGPILDTCTLPLGWKASLSRPDDTWSSEGERKISHILFYQKPFEDGIWRTWTAELLLEPQVDRDIPWTVVFADVRGAEWRKFYLLQQPPQLSFFFSTKSLLAMPALNWLPYPLPLRTSELIWLHTALYWVMFYGLRLWSVFPIDLTMPVKMLST